MTDRDREILETEATTAWRERDLAGRIQPHPAWADLDPDARLALHDATRELRAMEAALDPRGLSTTARAILARVEAAPRIGGV